MFISLQLLYLQDICSDADSVTEIHVYKGAYTDALTSLGTAVAILEGSILMGRLQTSWEESTVGVRIICSHACCVCRFFW